MLLNKNKIQLNVENINKITRMLNFLDNEKTFEVLQILCDSDGLYVSEIIS